MHSKAVDRQFSLHASRLAWMVLALLAPAASAQTITITINGNQGPWLQRLNPNFNYGYGDNQAPAVISASSGIPFATGGTVTVTYVSGQVDVLPGQYPNTDANGVSTDPTNTTVIPTYGDYPSFFMKPSSYPVYASELVGTFANNGVIVGTPFPIGDGPKNFVIPAGANQLLLGIDLANQCFRRCSGRWPVDNNHRERRPGAMVAIAQSEL
jgi:hypothetical protein